MKGHRAIPKMALATAGAVGVVLCVGLWLLGKAEPSVGGRTVEEWMNRAAWKRFVKSPQDSSIKPTPEEEVQEAAKVLRELGPQAEPAMVRYLEAVDSRWGPLYEGFYYRKAPTFVRRYFKPPISALSRRQTAVTAIGRMGRVSLALEAALRGACKDTNEIVQEGAAAILGYRGSCCPETMQVFEEALKQRKTRDDARIAEYLKRKINLTPRALGADFDFTPRTLEEMIGDLDRPYYEARYVAANALQKPGPAAAPAVPALVRRLGDTNEIVRNASIRALGNIGPGASNALPALRGFLGNESHFTEAAAKEAIEKIQGR